MTVTYFKRYRMLFDLSEGVPAQASLPDGYHILPWEGDILGDHAEAKFRSFRNELDSNVFPCLGEIDGCLRLMKEISGRQGFLPEATWLIQHRSDDWGTIENVGTVQGIREPSDQGAIQNVGIVPEHRARGLGSALLSYSLAGFSKADVKQVSLEVTAQNLGAIRLYQRFGFRIDRTVFKSIDVDYPV